MSNYRIFILPLAFLSVISCKNFQEQNLDDSDKLALEEPAEVGIPGNEFQKGVLFDFTQPINMWWSGSDKLSVQKYGDTLRVDVRDAGQKYECWGTELPDLIDMSKASVLKVTARTEGRTIPQIGISLKDMDGYDTNMDRPTQRIRKSETMEEYYYNYEGKWKQSWPDRQIVNPNAIAEILIFVNPGQMNWTGTLYIDNIEIITPEEMPSPEEIKRRRRAAAAKARGESVPEPAPAPEQPAAAPDKNDNATKPAQESSPTGISEKTEEPAKDVIAPAQNIAETSDNLIQNSANASAILKGDVNIKSWWASSKNKIQLEETPENNLAVQLNNVGPAFESFGKLFSHIDFTKTPVLKVRLKVEGGKVGDLRVDIKDSEGFTTNAKPNVKVFESGTDFVDLYFDYTDRFNQNFPDVRRVDPGKIVEVIFFVNPGGKPFTGKLTFNEISAISLEDFKKVKN